MQIQLDMDKNGVALGNLVIGQGEARHDYCIDLLKAGMAHCDERAVDRMGAAGQVNNTTFMSSEYLVCSCRKTDTIVGQCS
jgi:aspartate oxidase